MTIEGWTTTVDLPPASVVAVSLGPFLTGIMIAHLLLGIVCSKAIAYFHQHFSHDGLFFRLIVVSLVILDIFLGIMDFASIYRTIVLHFGDFNKFDQQDWTSWAEPAMTASVALIAHIFYICRCWAVTHSLPVAVFLTLAAFLAFASGITITVYAFAADRFSKMAGATTPAYIWFLSTSVCDISIATILVAYFWRAGSAFRSTNVMLSRLRQTTIEAGSLPAICALLNLILFLALPHAVYYLLAQYSITHLYALSVLYTLLGRHRLRELLSAGKGSFVTGFDISDASSPFSVIRFTGTAATQHIQMGDTANSYDYENADNIAMDHIQYDSNLDLKQIYEC